MRIEQTKREAENEFEYVFRKLIKKKCEQVDVELS